MRPPLVALVVVLVAGTLFVPVGATAHAPAQVCSVCHTLEAEDRVEVVESELTVAVGEGSSSTWTSRVTVSEKTAQRLSERQYRLDALVNDSFDAGYPTAVTEPENLTYSLDGQTLTVSYRATGTVESGRLGVLLFTGFDSAPGAEINTDRLTVRGPPDKAVTRSSDPTTVEDNRAVWSDKRESRLGGTVAFADRSGPLAQIQTTLAVRAHEFGELTPGLIQFGTVPAVLLGLLSVGLVTADSRPRVSKRLAPGDGSTRTVLKGLAAAGLGYAALSGLLAVLDYSIGYGLITVGMFLAIPAVTTVATLIALERLPPWLEQTDSLAGVRGNEPRLAGGAVAVWTALLLISGPVGILLVFLCSPLVFLPFGVLAGIDHWARWLFPPVAVGTAVTAAIPAAAQVGLIFITPAMLALMIAGWGLLGVPLFVFGSERTSRQTTASQV